MIQRQAIILFFISFSNVLMADPPPNDDCENAIHISGEGIFHFDNTEATEDGFGECIVGLFDPPMSATIPHDVWYCWKAPDTVGFGSIFPLTVETCGETTVDTKIAIYGGGDQCAVCSGLDYAVCADNNCITQSRVSLTAYVGSYYLIRIGTSTDPELSGGSGTFSITLEEYLQSTDPPPPVENCQQNIPSDAFTSDGQNMIVADNFTPAETSTVNEIHWRGGYFYGNEDCLNSDDAFEIRYYLDDGGLPGPLIAGPFNNQNSSLYEFKKSTTGQAINDEIREYLYSGVHEPLPMIGGECYWIEIRNVSQDVCTWHWEIANGGDGWSVQDGRLTGSPDGYDSTDRVPEDMAFCLDLPLAQTGECDITPPVNDVCSNPIEIFEGDTFFDTIGATTVNTSYSIRDCYFPFNDVNVHNDIWFDYEADCTGEVAIGLCDSNYDNKIVVYHDTDCPSDFEAIVCNDDACSTDPAFDYLPEVLTYEEPASGQVSTIESQSDCFETHDTPGCDDPECMERVCFFSEYCCFSLWFPECVRLANRLCLNARARGLQSEVSFSAIEGEFYQIRIGGYRGEMGTGTIHLRMGETDPHNKNMLNLAALINCYTGSCELSSCDESIYETPCCKLYDFDRDGDVDIEDFTRVRDVLTGP